MQQHIIAEIAQLFKNHGMAQPRREAENLLCDLLDCSRAELFQKELVLDSDQRRLALEWAKRRLEGEPLPYISGHVQFYGCRIEVNRSVLIPRLETELLIDKVAAVLQQEELEGKQLWDVCCGSGYIGIALKKKFPALDVTLSDISSEALSLASKNAAANQTKVECLCGDLLAPFAGKKAHYVVCNPPYVSEQEYEGLDREVKDFEPRLAIVGGESGLVLYERLAKELPPYLNPHAKVWLEIGYRQGEAVNELFQSRPWKNQKVELDWAGHDRFFFLENE